MAEARVLFHDLIDVDEAQFHVVSDYTGPDTEEAFRGQVNGLCGAASPGVLVLFTGVRTGPVFVTATAHDGPPPWDEQQWEDVVEASFTPASPDVLLAEWGGGEGGAGSGERDDDLVERRRVMGIRATVVVRRDVEDRMLDRHQCGRRLDEGGLLRVGHGPPLLGTGHRRTWSRGLPSGATFALTWLSW